MLGSHLRGLLDEGITVFLIDHDMGLVLNVCDYLYVLDFGEVIAEGTAAQIRTDPAVVAAYLGESAAEAQAHGGDAVAAVQEIVAQQIEATPTRWPAMISNGDALVEVTGLSTGYGGIPVVRDLDLTVHAGEVVALLGPNGAGKTTTLLTIFGDHRAAGGLDHGPRRSRSTAATRARSLAAAWPTSPKTVRCSSTSPSRRTSGSG